MAKNSIMVATFTIVEFIEEWNLFFVVYKSWDEVPAFFSEMAASYIETQQLKVREQQQL
jgi:ABC-type anion transport system duplicated permease subunit